jgi:hypothetical protein
MHKAPASDAPEPRRASSIRSAAGERTTALVLACLALIYAIAIASHIGRRLWFDELFTYYIARQPDLPRLFDALSHTDLNPPLIYLLVRLFHSVFGPSELVTRLPSVIAFFVGSGLSFVVLKRRIGVCWGAAAILLFWSTPYFRYATEARPYGLMIGFFSLTLFAYDASRRVPRGRWVVPGIAAGSVGLMLSHVLAPLSLLPFCAAEAARCVVRRRVDWPVWGALLLPMTMGVAYIPAGRHFQQILFPKLYQASTLNLAYFFERLGLIYLFPMLITALVALIVGRFSRSRNYTIPAGWPGAAWALGVVAVPVAMNFLLMRTGGAFWERYCIAAAMSFYMMVTMGVACLAGRSRAAGLFAALLMAFAALSNGYPSDSQTPVASAMRLIPNDIPLVAASGLTFLEMDRYDREFQPRLYYMVDRAAAIEYAHSTIFENMPLLARYFPIRSHVESYSAFVAAHPHFLVLSRTDYLEAWVLRKLCDDGAEIRTIRSLEGPDKPYQLYDVRFGS